MNCSNAGLYYGPESIGNLLLEIEPFILARISPVIIRQRSVRLGNRVAALQANSPVGKC